jgi:Exopolysaccharide biosynthesis protein related to N-acetylglucosamine-1-phosphodiester alpha-N-acetylglucosaminidase
VKNDGGVKQLPVFVLVIIDTLALGAALCIFALFHHVLPKAYSTDITKDVPKAVVASADVSSEDSAAVDSSDFGEKFIGVFTDGEVESSATSYRSGNIYIRLTAIQENGVTYYIQDIYLKDLTSLRTAFAHGEYGKAITEHPLDMARDNNAIVAINGDYYGTHSNRGVIIRNGVLYRADEAYGDVCLLGNDGVMYGVDEADFNVDPQSYTNEIYQGWCFGPILVENGEARSGFEGDIAGQNPRTAIGYYEPGHYCFITVDGRQEGYSVGMTLDELAKLAKSLGCKFAYNLDGGKSSVMVWRGDVANEPYEEGRESSDIVYIADGGGAL